MTTAFVLSGGASLGAAQVGMLAALADTGTTPDLIVGTSVGAVNGGWIAGRPDLDGINDLARLWRTLGRGDVFPTRPLVGLLGFLGRKPNLVPDDAIRRLVEDHLCFERLEDAPIPLHVIVADLLTGEDVRLSSGNAVDAIVASASIPAVFPPVVIDGRPYMDGGVVNNTPISHAVDLGAETIWVLSTGHACAMTEPPRSALATALHAFGLAVNQRLAADIDRYETQVDLRVVPPLCPLRTSPIDFSHSDELIRRGHDTTLEWLASSPAYAGQSALLDPHRH